MPNGTKRTTGGAAGPFCPIGHLLFPPGYELVVGTSQIYELELAIAESRALTSLEAVLRSAYFASVEGQKTNHFRMCTVSPLQVDKASSARRKTFFQANLFKTGYSTHGLFPYRGKFHPQMIKAVINAIGMKPGDTLLDPMMGSGTACLEATLQGMNAVGIDASPFCVLMAEGKQAGAKASVQSMRSLEKEASDIFEGFDVPEPDLPLFRWNGPKATDSSEKKPKSNRGLDAFLRLCYLDAMGYAARRAKKSIKELFPVVLQRYVSAVQNFASVRDELGLELGNATYREGNACDLKAVGVADSSIDGIVTSPPYSFAIDYLANDAPQLQYMGVTADPLRDVMIGLRGESLKERVSNYLADMKTVLKECHRVLRSDRYAVVVVGTNSNQLKRVMGTGEDDLKMDRETIRAADEAGFTLAYDLIHPIEGIHNTMRDEHLLFFRKT